MLTKQKDYPLILWLYALIFYERSYAKDMIASTWLDENDED